MLVLGKQQTLIINRFSDYGAYLSDEPNGENEVLLPKKFVQSTMKEDDSIVVFLYKDSEQRPVATTQVPLLELGKIGILEVISSIKAGYFLNMGLDKDLYLPYSEAKGQLKKGQKVLVKLLKDDKEQLFASMKIYNHLKTAIGIYNPSDKVTGVVYEIKPEMGAFVAVDLQYHGLIPAHEIYKEIKVGATITARITKVREDGRVNLSIKEKSPVQIQTDVEIILKALKEGDGTLFLNDDSEPDHIKKRLNISKRAFKRVVGMLLKEGKIELLEDGIQLKKTDV